MLGGNSFNVTSLNDSLPPKIKRLYIIHEHLNKFVFRKTPKWSVMLLHGRLKEEEAFSLRDIQTALFSFSSSRFNHKAKKFCEHSIK
jgi:hypothetical protein